MESVAERLGQFFTDYDNIERIISRWWFLLTAFCLFFSVFIMIIVQPPTNRMQRASTGIILSYFIIIIASFYRAVNGRVELPQPLALLVAGFSLLTAIYFTFALITEWGRPILSLSSDMLMDNIKGLSFADRVIITLLVFVSVAIVILVFYGIVSM